MAIRISKRLKRQITSKLSAEGVKITDSPTKIKKALSGTVLQTALTRRALIMRKRKLKKKVKKK